MLYNTSCSHDLMAANLTTSNAGERIVIRGNTANNLVGTLLYTFTVQVFFQTPWKFITANLSIIMHTYTKIRKRF